MSLNDFLASHPVPQPPRDEPPPDPALEAFADAQAHSRGTPMRGRGRSMRLVDNSVCRFPCQVPGHNHNQPEFRPQPDLDEVGVGWTVQHVPLDRNRHMVPKRCVLCWDESDDLKTHKCEVAVLVRG